MRVDGEAQALPAQISTRRALADVDRAAVLGEALDDGGSSRPTMPLGVVGQQHAGLLEALADGRHPERQAAGVDAQPARGLGVGAAVAERLEVGVAVVGVDRAAGEHVGAARRSRTAGCAAA